MSDIEALTPRQREVLELVGRGQQNKVIASHLDVSEGRVEQHVSRLKEILGVNSRAELTEIWLDAVRKIPPLGDTLGAKTSVPPDHELPQAPLRNDAGSAVFSDAAALNFAPHWEAQPAPRAVPERLDGEDATRTRLIEIGKLTALIMIILILSLATLSAIGDAVR